jgi:hypothetical protein
MLTSNESKNLVKTQEGKGNGKMGVQKRRGEGGKDQILDSGYTMRSDKYGEGEKFEGQNMG